MGAMHWNAFENVVPRPAAAAILLTTEPAPRVLLARRNKALKFMAGHHVFPGGRVQDDDDPALVRGAPDEATARAVLAAAREVFEETGLLCSRRVRPDRETLRAGRRALIAGECGFGDLLHRHHIRLEAADFAPAGEWVTPPFAPVRFDTRYFLFRYDGPLDQEVVEEDAEITALEWLSPAEARRRWQAGGLRVSPPVAHVLLHLAALPLDAALDRLRRRYDHVDIAAHRFEVRRGLHLVPLPTPTLPPATHTNCLILGEEALIVVDPGPVEEFGRARLRAHLDELCALGGRVEAVLLTHSHPDHTGAAAHLREVYGAPIWAHPETARQLPFEAQRAVTHGEAIELPGDPGWRLRCIHTPGHDPGHLCFYEERTKALIVGDMIANPGTIIISGEYGGDMDAYLRSLDDLRAVGANLTIPGHGLPLGREAGRAKIDELVAHRLERERKIRAAWENGARETPALLAEAYADTPRELWSLAEHQLHAHLKRLGLA